jgi:hypothetical protein
VRAVVVVMVRAESLLVRPLLLCNCIGGALIAGKITVQVDANATRDHFGGAQGLVSSKLTPWRQRIETPHLRDAESAKNTINSIVNLYRTQL